MSRPLRITFPGALYHLTSRGNAQAAIYADDADRRAFLDLLTQIVQRYHWLCHAYCLMDNHYHLLIETPEGNLSQGARQLNGVYTQQSNRRHGRVGHVFQGRYKAILVEKDTYLLELCRYVVLNPVRAGMVGSAREYRWSSYRATADAYHAALVIAGRHGARANGYVLSPGKSASISRCRLGRLLVRIPYTTSWSMSAYPWINRLRNAMIR